MKVQNIFRYKEIQILRKQVIIMSNSINQKEAAPERRIQEKPRFKLNKLEQDEIIDGIYQVLNLNNLSINQAIEMLDKTKETFGNIRPWQRWHKKL